MITDSYIEKYKTETFQKGNSVVMHSCGEASFPEYKDKVWICQTDSFLSSSNQEVVFLDGFSGYFYTEYLKNVTH